MKRLPRQETPYLVVDVIIHQDEKILLVERKMPAKGELAIPGGFVKWGESVEEAALREIKEETGLKVKLEEILGVYSAPERDPRGHITTIVFVAEPISGKLKLSSEHLSLRWNKISDLDFSRLAFDHGKIINDYLRWRKEKRTYWSSR
jgi:8-oxo-dGTP diphosphatase